MRRSRWAAVSLIAGIGIVVAVAAAADAAAKPAYFRYPDLNGDRIVFSAEADLWVAPAAGGAARRLTTHPGTEYYPKFSPDGTRIAFTGEYDGNPDVYVIPSEGGEPRRITWLPGPDQVIGWTPDGKKVIFRRPDEPPRSEMALYKGVHGVAPFVPEVISRKRSSRVGRSTRRSTSGSARSSSQASSALTDRPGFSERYAA